MPALPPNKQERPMSSLVPALRLAGLTAVLACSAPGTTLADDRAELEARIAALEAMVAELRADLEATAASEDAPHDGVVRLAPPTGPAPLRSVEPAGFATAAGRIEMGGFIDVDAHVSDISDGSIAPGSIARDFYIPGATPVGGAGGDAVTDFTAKGSRFFLAARTPTDRGDIRGRIEMDFLGSPGGDERVSNSYNPRLRVAWVEHAGWRFGQDWSTFQNTAAIPESVSFLVASDGMIFVRQAQLRYTRGNWQIALENPDTTLTATTGGRINNGDNALPDLVLRYNRNGAFGNLSFAALARNLTGPSGGAETAGWGLSASGRIRLGDRADLRGSVTAGEGVGRYIGLNAVNAAATAPGGEIEAIPVLGGYFALRRQTGETGRINLGYSRLEADHPDWLDGTPATRRVQSGFANYMTDIAPGVTVGAEVLVGERETEDGRTGTLSRFTLSTKYTF